MIFDFFKVLLSNKPKEQDLVIEEPIENENEKIVLSEQYKNILENKLPPIKSKQKSTNNIDKNKKPVTIESTKEITMSEIFLVVIDTTGRVEAKNFQQGIQNFYFIHASDEETAKQIVLSTFRKRPHLVSQLQYSVKATRLSSIVKTVGPGANFWTYVPFGGQRQPGQQGVPPKPEQLLRPDQYGQPSAANYVPSAPIGGEEITANDLRGVQFNGADAALLNKGRPAAAPLPEEAPPLSAEQEYAVKQMADQNKSLMEQNKQIMEQMASMQQIVAALAANQPKSRKKSNQTSNEASPQVE